MAKTTVKVAIQDTYIVSTVGDANYWDPAYVLFGSNYRALAKMQPFALPAGKTLFGISLHAKLMYNGTATIYVSKAIQDFDIRTVTYDTRPVLGDVFSMGSYSLTASYTAQTLALSGITTIEELEKGILLYASAQIAFIGMNTFIAADQPYIEIIYADAPSQPVIVLPVSGTAIDKAVTSTYRFQWQHIPSDVSQLSQKSYELQWSTDAYTWTTISATTATQYVDATVTSMPSGAIFWRVRTIDTDDVPSDWSEQQLIYIASIPAAPSITNSVFTASKPRIAWTTGFTQTGFEVQILQGSTVLLDASVTTADKFYDVPVALENATAFTVNVRSKNTSGIYSAWATSTISTDYLTPGIPGLEIIKKKSIFELVITNPAASDIVEETLKNLIYRDGVCIGETETGTYLDWSAPFGTYCEYYVVAVGASGTAESTTAKRMLEYPAFSILTLTSDPTKTFTVQYNITMSRDGEYGGTLVKYAGREKPCVEYDEHTNRSYSVRASLTSLDSFNAFEALLADKAIFLLRTQDAKMYGVATNVGASKQDYTKKIYETSFVLSEVEYDEAIL